MNTDYFYVVLFCGSADLFLSLLYSTCTPTQLLCFLSRFYVRACGEKELPSTYKFPDALLLLFLPPLGYCSVFLQLILFCLSVFAGRYFLYMLRLPDLTLLFFFRFGPFIIRPKTCGASVEVSCNSL